MTLIDWFRSTNKTFKNGSVGWKGMVLDFQLIGNWTASEIGNGRSVRLGLYPWEGAGEDYRLSISVLNNLSEKMCFKLMDVQVQHHP